MARSVRDALLRALDELGERSFKRFRSELMNWEIKKGFNKIPRSKLEKAETDDAVDVIVRHYMESYGAELTVDVLEAIDEKKVASNLKKNLENVRGFSWKKKTEEEPQSTSKASSSSAPKSWVGHFVDKHRNKLIARCVLVDPILDDLVSEGLLSDEGYDAIRAEKTSQKQMRKLFTFTRNWSASDKNTLYESLKEHNPHLTKDLEKS